MKEFDSAFVVPVILFVQDKNGWCQSTGTGIEQYNQTTAMKKATFIFPTYESLWQFKDNTKAINVKVEPKKHTISGLFYPQEIEMAITTYKAATQTAMA
jgi:hypothetical protein